MWSLTGRTVIVVGASRGIGRAIAVRAGTDRANVVVAARTAEQRDGSGSATIHDVAAEVEAAGGRALPLQVDVRDADRVEWMVARARDRFGAVDALVINAGTAAMLPAEHLSAARYHDMMSVNVHGAFLAARAAIPALKRSPNPHVLAIAPPVSMDPRWFASHAAYTVSAYARSMLVVGLAAELLPAGIAVNALWPRTLIATDGLGILGGADLSRRARRPEIVAEAALHVLTCPAREVSGQFFVDEDVLRQAGVSDFSPYSMDPTVEPLPDLFVGDPGASLA
jgi:citronellol/citronellal dehydrogenase